MNVLPPFSELKRCLTFCPEDTRSTFLRNVDKYPAEFTVSHPRKLTVFLVVTSIRSSNQAQIVQPPVTSFLSKRVQFCSHLHCVHPRGELSYLAPLGSENLSAPYFKLCFFRGGYYPPPDKHHASQSQVRNNKYFILYIEFCINNKI